MHFDAGAVAGTMRTSIAVRGVLRTWEELIHPVWSALGGDGDAAGTPVAAERLFSRAMSEILAATQRLAHRAPARALLVCAEEEHRTLPLDTLAAALTESGVGSCVLGARVPLPAVAAAAGRLRPGVVVIWSQVGERAGPPLVTGCPVVTAGPGWTRTAAPSSTGMSTALQQTMALLRAG